MKFKININKAGRKQEDKVFIVTDFDDLVFENRNREYGAYQLRKKYNRVVLGGVVLASLLGIFAVVIPFLARPNSDRVISGGGGYTQVRMENLAPPEEQIYIPPAPPANASKAPETVQYVPPVVVDSLLPVDLKQMTTDEAIASDGIETLDTEGKGGFGEDLIPGGDGTGSDEPLFIVETMPSFKGGDKTKFMEWVQKRANYPQAAIDNKIRGTVQLTFIVEKDGSVSNVTVLKGVHPLLDEEAVKVISGSPKWTPGLQRGQPVRVRFQIPLTFQY